MPAFADATFLVALMDPDDQWHDQARALLPFAKRNVPLHTHALGVAEVIAIVGGRLGGKVAREAYARLRDTTEIHLPSLEDLDEAMTHVVRYDGTLSLSDALALHVMRREGIGDILSFDKDFDGKDVNRVHQPPGPRRPRRRK